MLLSLALFFFRCDGSSMREIKSTCYQRSFTSRYMKIVLLKVDLNLSCCEGFDFILFFPVNVWKGIAFSFPSLSFQCKKLTMLNKTSTFPTPPACISLALEEVNIPESTNFLTCTLGRDLFDSRCFMGEAEKQVHDFCFT